MKKPIFVVVSVALVVIGLAAAGQATAEALSVAAATNLSAQAANQLVVDWVLTFSSAGPSINLDKGDRSYGEFDLYAEGTVGIEDPTGEGKWDGVATEPVGTTGWYESETYHIFGQGVIEGVSTGPPWEGAIVGGTGVFAGASGEYSVTCEGFEGFCRITFTFNAAHLFLPVISAD